MFGIDKTVIKSWELKSIELKKLLNKNNVIIQTKGYTTNVIEYKTNEPIKIAYIKIKDKYKFNVLQFGVKVIKGRFITYSFLEIHINSFKDKINNLEPLSLNEYYRLIDRIGDYLAKEYGIHIDFTNSKFEMIELNKTIELDRDFNEYEHILNMISLLVPKTYKDKFINIDKFNNMRQITVSNKSVDVKIYNKTKQLLELYKIKINKQYLRIEYTLKTSKKVEDVFKSSGIFKLSDDEIKHYLKDRIEKELVNPLEKHIRKGQSRLKRIAKEEKQRDSRRWVRVFVLRAINEEKENIPLLFCLDQIKIIIKKETKSNYARTMRNLEKDFEHNYKFNENLLKLEELKIKIFN